MYNNEVDLRLSIECERYGSEQVSPLEKALLDVKKAISEEKHVIRVIELEGARVRRRSLTESVVKRNLSEMGQAQTRELTTSSKMTLRWSNRALSTVLRGWVEHTVALTGITKMLSKIVMQTRQSVMYKAHVSWKGQVEELRHRLGVLQEMELKMRTVVLNKSWATWEEVVDNLKRQATVGRKVLKKWKIKTVGKDV